MIREKAAVRGIVLLEACVAMALVGLVLAMVSLLVVQYERSTDYFLNQRRLQLAAESQIERMRAGVLPVEDSTFTDEAGISYTVSVRDAADVWAPLQRVAITARVVGKHNRKMRYEVRTFVSRSATGQGGNR